MLQITARTAVTGTGCLYFTPNPCLYFCPSFSSVRFCRSAVMVWSLPFLFACCGWYYQLFFYQFCRFCRFLWVFWGTAVQPISFCRKMWKRVTDFSCLGPLTTNVDFLFSRELGFSSKNQYLKQVSSVCKCIFSWNQRLK